MLLVGALLFGCGGDDFPEYNELEGLRVLAIQAEPPSIAPGESTTLRALVYDEDDDPDTLEYSWSWCPARLPIAAGADCALSEDALRELAGIDGLSFELGEEPTAELSNLVPAEVLDALCSADADETDADQGFLLDCSQGLPISVRLELRRGDAEIVAIKDVRLLAEASETPEDNPRIDDVSFVRIPGVIADADVLDNDAMLETDAEPIAEDGSSELMLGERYRLYADVPADASERFLKPPDGFDDEPEEKRENLFVSWFVTSGSTDKERTAFTDGSSELQDIRPNTWELPKRGDEDADEAQLILVIRDERGGVSWLQRRVELTR